MPDQPKPDQPKPDQPKPDQPKPETPNTGNPPPPPSKAAEGFPDEKEYALLETDSAKYEKLKLFRGDSKSEDHTLAKAYETAVRITQFLHGFQQALEALETTLKKKTDEKWAEVALIACRALEQGVETYWDSIKVEAEGLLQTGQYPFAKTKFQSTTKNFLPDVPVFPKGSAEKTDKIPQPLPVYQKGASTDHAISEVVFSIIAFACNRHKGLSTVAPMLGISPSQVMEIIHAIGWRVFLEYQPEDKHMLNGNNKTDSGKAGSDKAGSGKTGSDKAGSDKTGSDKTGSDKTGSDKTGSDNNSPNNIVINKIKAQF